MKTITGGLLAASLTDRIPHRRPRHFTRRRVRRVRTTDADAERDRLRVGGGGRYASRRPGDSANSFWLDSYVVADAFVTYDTALAGRRVPFQLNLKNVFDATCYTSAVNVYGVAIGDPRRAIGTMSFAF